MDLFSIVYSFMLLVGTGQFVINEATEIAPALIEVDVETMGMRENQRYILLVDHGHITQQARVPLTATECSNPN